MVGEVGGGRGGAAVHHLEGGDGTEIAEGVDNGPGIWQEF